MPDKKSQSILQVFLSRRLESQLGTLVFSAMLLMVVSVSVGTSLLIDRSLKNAFIANGKNITALLADQVRLAVLVGSPDGAREDSSVIQAFPGVQRIEIYEKDGGLLIDSGTQIFRQAEKTGVLVNPILSASRRSGAVLEYDDPEYWQFISPVFSLLEESEIEEIESSAEASEQIGAVRVLISKEQLYNGRQNIIVGNIFVLVAVAFLMMLALRMLSRRLTKPLESIAATMEEGARGEKLDLRVALQGSEETRTMGSSFNLMMQELENRESQLAAARDSALDAARLKSEFAANVSHEIRTPLNGILGTLNLLGDTTLTAAQRELIELAGSSSEALMALINDILDFSRLSLDQTTLVSIEFGLMQLLEELVFLHAQSAAAYPLDVSLHYDLDLPLAVKSDPNKIRQLLNNLISNSIKFTDQGYVEVSAVKEVDSDGKLWVRFAVKDSGIGISESDLRTIFLPYSQSDGSMSRKYIGTGLGLSISERLAEVLHGDIGVHSELGKGSEFYVKIPVEYHEAATAGRTLHGQASRDIYIVATDQRLQRICKNFCHHAGMQPRVLASQQALLEVLQSQSTDTNVLALFYFSSSVADMSIDSGLLAYAESGQLHGIVAGRQAEQKIDDAFLGYLSTPLRLGAFFNVIASLEGQHLPDVERLVDNFVDVRVHAATRVLLVEDNSVNQKVARAMLEKLGAEVELVENGQAAIDSVHSNSYDIIFMDCQMPVMNGYDATRAIREISGDAASIPIIAMTANVGPQDRAQCHDAGMNDFLAKPFTLQELIVILQKWIRKRNR